MCFWGKAHLMKLKGFMELKGEMLHGCKMGHLLGVILLGVGLSMSVSIKASAAGTTSEIIRLNQERKAEEISEQLQMEIGIPKCSKGVNLEAYMEYLSEDQSLDSCEDVREDIVDYALTFVGNKYVLGGNSLEKGTDCSGFTRLIYGEYGYSIGKVANDQYHNLVSIEYEEMKPGDLIFYGSKKHASHVAMYIGDGMIVHAANSKRGITTDKVTYMKNVIGYGRVILYEES